MFYFGGCAGGIWKTVDGESYWRCISDGYLTSAAVGAIAVARSDRNVIYAELARLKSALMSPTATAFISPSMRDAPGRILAYGTTKHIGRICIHPSDPNIVYVAALGDAFGPNEERGYFVYTTVGKRWKKVLYRSTAAGAVDISMDPNNSRVLFAAFWETRRSFWNLSSGGPGSGLFRSTDGGDTWEEISRSPGLPTGLLGKLGVAVSPAKAGRVWTLVEADDDKTAGYRSDDYGSRWTMVSCNRDLMHRPWYYTHVFAGPSDPDTVYVANLQMWKSTDGGMQLYRDHDAARR